MDNKKIIVAFIAVAVVFGLFWIAGVRNVIPVEDVSRILSIQKFSKEKVVPTVAIAQHKELGKYLTDGKERALYITTKAECTGECLSVWPPYFADKAILEDGGRLGTVDNEAAGELQYTWDGKWLYYYTEDSRLGDVNGHEVGGVWFLVQE